MYLNLIVAVGGTVSLASVCRERAELLAATRDRLHLGEVEREEVVVEGVEWVAVRVLRHGGRDELRGHFLRVARVSKT